MIGDFILAFLVVGSGLLILFLKSLHKDQETTTTNAANDRAQADAAREEARKYQAGVPLVCLGCGAHFCGPLTEAGCPKCHLSSLVMTDIQFDAAQSSSKEQN